MRYLPKSILKRIYLLLIIFIPSQAMSGIYIDPWLGYELSWASSKYDATVLSTNTTVDMNWKGTSPEYGARLGYKFMGLMGGFHYSLASFDLDPVDLSSAYSGTSALATSYSTDQTLMGLWGGFDFPILLRAWVAYYHDIEWDQGTNGGLNGTGYGAGIGFSPIPIPLPIVSLSFNIEYRQMTFDEAYTAAGGTTALTGGYERSVHQVVFSVSTPLNI